MNGAMALTLGRVYIYIYISNIYSNVWDKAKKIINNINNLKRSYIIEKNNRHC